jgi:hypothetical protein
MVKSLGASTVLAAALGACAPAAQPPAVYVSTQASSSAAVGTSDTSATDGDEAPGASEPMLTPAQRAVIVLVDKHVDRPTEVLGVFDFHSAETSEDKGFDELRRRAAAMGADAVIGAEFEHGDDGGPSHLSGMAVRFLDH